MFRKQSLSCRQPTRRGRVVCPRKSGSGPVWQGRRSTDKLPTRAKATMRIAYGYLTPAEALSNGQGNDRNMAWEMLHFIVMRPVLILFVMSGLGFIFILHKKDAPEA